MWTFVAKFLKKFRCSFGDSEAYVRRLKTNISKLLLSVSLLPAFILPFEQVAVASVTFKHTRHKSHSALSVPVQFSGASNTWSAYKTSLSHRGLTLTQSGLPALADGDVAMPSNANNFHGEINASVDPRTGVASFSMPVASTLYDNGQGKRDLILSYSGSALPHGVNRLGLGTQWNFNVGQETPSTSEVSGHKTTDIITGDGHGFTMESDHNAQGETYWHPLRHKLGDVTITGQPGDWTISTAGGTREHIQYGYESWEQGHDGQRVWFYYDRHGPQDITRRLTYVCAHPLTQNQVDSGSNQCSHNGVWLTYQGDDITIHGQQNIVLHLYDVAGETAVQSVSMPALSSDNEGLDSSQVKFGYDEQGHRPWLLTRVTEPSGEINTFLYNDESDRHTLQSQGLPTGFNLARTPVVTEQVTTPAPANKGIIPVRRLWYQYSGGTTDLHNYTGYLSGVSSEPGKDNLFDRSDDYTYSVVKDNGLTSVKTTYNKYHLPLTITQTDDLHHSLVAKNDATYSSWKGTTFAKLPLTYSFPRKTAKTLYTLTSKGQDSTISPAKVLQQKQYDNNGQVIWQEDAYGRQTFTQYCPPQGDSHCPKMDPNWPQVTLPEKVIQLPAKQTPAGSKPFIRFATTDDPAPATEVEFNYQLIPVAGTYKNRIEKYEQLLKQQWQSEKQKWKLKNKHQAGQLASDDLFSDSRLVDAIGKDNSPLAGNWQVTTKQVGTLPVESVDALIPGQALPDLTSAQLSTTTTYSYNHDQKSQVYGQLSQLTVTKYNPPVRVDLPANHIAAKKQKGLYFQLPNNGRPEQVTFNVKHSVDTNHYTRTTDIEVSSEQPSADIHSIHNLLQDGSGALSLGKTVYSLTNGVKLSAEDTLKTLHINWTYDGWQRPVKEVMIPASGGDPQTISWAYISTDNEQSVVKTLADGTQQKTVYAGSGNNQQVLSSWHRNKDQAVAPMQGTSNWIEDGSSTYTQTDQPASNTVYHASDNNGPDIALTTTYGYDALNRQVWKRTPDGSVSIAVRNDPQMLLIRYQVVTGSDNQQEKLAPELSVVQSNTIGKPVAQYRFALDPNAVVNGKAVYSDKLKTVLTSLEHRLQPVTTLKATQSYGLLPLPDEDGLFAFVNDAINAKAWLSVTTTRYDGNGRRTEQTQPDGAQTHWQWKQGNLVATIAPNGSIIHDTFDIQGNKVSRCVTPVDQAVCHVLGTRHYDGEGNLAWQADEYGHKISYTYDADGRILSMTTPGTDDNPHGHVFTYTYNSFAKTSASVDGVIYASYSYNQKTWQLTDAEDTISHLHYEYDDNSGQLISVVRSAPKTLPSPAGISYPEGTETISYDRYGQATRIIDFAGNRFTATHDRYGRLLQSKVLLSGSLTPTVLSSTTYDVYFNRPVSVSDGSGIVREFTYNDLGRLAGTTDRQGNHVLQRLGYSYDPQTQNITTFTRSEDGDSATQTYVYDKNTNNLTSMSCSATDKPGKVSKLCPRDIDLSGSQLTVPPIITAQHYTFDDWNNIKTVNEQLITADGKPSGKTTIYTYNQQKKDNYDPHRMIAFDTQWQANVSSFSAIPKTITYDSAGRIIKDADGNTLHYNAFGQQDKFTNVNTHEYTQYTYDSSGHQVAEQPFDEQGRVLQQPLYMIYQGDTVAEQIQSDAKGHLHTSAELAGVAHSEDGHVTRWYLHDYKGDVITTLNTSGQRTSDHVYTPYGMDYDLMNKTTQGLPARLKLATQAAWWQNHQPGFDGQMTDPATGYQFLGGGYRAYNPVYRHFMSHDSYSPFTKIDGYGFGDNNPVMKTDPTGHLPKWAGYLMGALSITMAIGSAFLLPVAVGSAVASGVFTGAVAGGALATEVSSSVAAGGALGSIGIASGSLQIAGTAHPDNRALAITNQVFGIANGLAAVAMGVNIVMAGMSGLMTGASQLTSSFITFSGINSVFSGEAEQSSSILWFASMVGHAYGKKQIELSKAINILSIVDTIFMGTTIFSEFLAGTHSGYNGYLRGMALHPKEEHVFDNQSMEYLAKSTDVRTRAALAHNPDLPEHVMNKLAHDRHFEVRRGVASSKNYSSSQRVINTLLLDSDVSVRVALAENIHSPIAEVLKPLASDPSPVVRASVADNIHSGREVLERLAVDTDRSVRSAVASNSATHWRTRSYMRRFPENDEFF